MKNLCKENIYQQIYEKYIDDLLNFLFFKLRDLQIAEDIAQESFIKLWKNCHKILFNKAKSYLFTVANHLFLDMKKHEKVVRKHQQSTLPQDSTQESPEYLMIEEEFLLKIQEAIRDLTEKQREVFVLSRLEGKKYKEIAEILNITPKSVEKRMSAALKIIRKKIGNV